MASKKIKTEARKVLIRYSEVLQDVFGLGGLLFDPYEEAMSDASDDEVRKLIDHIESEIERLEHM